MNVDGIYVPLLPSPCGDKLKPEIVVTANYREWLPSPCGDKLKHNYAKENRINDKGSEIQVTVPLRG